MTAISHSHPQGRLGLTSPVALRLIDLAERATVVIAFLVYIRANYDPANLVKFAIAWTDAITVWFVLFRRQATSVSADPTDWLLALGGTLLPMFARPGATPLFPVAVGGVLALAGTVVILAAKLSLARSFGLAPANRGVRMRGAYVFIRHPMYLGYALCQLAYLSVNPTAMNAAFIAAATACQIGRILREERWLTQDRAYRRYARIVRYRMIPGLF